MQSTAAPVPPDLIGRFRAFSRFYTSLVGVLDEHYLEGDLSLAEARVLFEVVHRAGVSAAAVAASLRVDPGHVSRLVRALEARGLLERGPAADGRTRSLSATESGRAALERVERASDAQVAELLARLGDDERRVAVRALERARGLLDGTRDPGGDVLLRTHEPGDVGTIVARHAVLYAREYDFGPSFEAFCAEIGARFLRNFDERRERCWIAEVDDAFAGSVLLVRESDSVAKLRLLLVEPSARGRGVGRRLVRRCIRTARDFGYTTLTLWTHDFLTAAARIYLSEGFRLVRSETHAEFGRPMTGQFYELAL